MFRNAFRWPNMYTVIFELAQFNKRVQGAQEPVIDFIESLYELAETCQFGTLKEELIRDRVVNCWH